jgi:hypothetical protein
VLVSARVDGHRPWPHPCSSPVRAGALPQACVTWVMCTRAMSPGRAPVPPLPAAMAENGSPPNIHKLLPGELPSFPPPEPDTRTACSDVPHRPQAASRPIPASLARVASVLWLAHGPLVRRHIRRARPHPLRLGPRRRVLILAIGTRRTPRTRWHIPHAPGHGAKRSRLLPLLALVSARYIRSLPSSIISLTARRFFAFSSPDLEDRRYRKTRRRAPARYAPRARHPWRLKLYACPRAGLVRRGPDR